MVGSPRTRQAVSMAAAEAVSVRLWGGWVMTAPSSFSRLLLKRSTLSESPSIAAVPDREGLVQRGTVRAGCALAELLDQVQQDAGEGGCPGALTDLACGVDRDIEFSSDCCNLAH